MHAGFNRRTATKVKGGKVQRKNRHRPTGTLGCVLDRESPGRGYAHVVTKKDIQDFIEIIPDWERLSEGLECIKVAAKYDRCDGAHEFFFREETGAIHLYSWPEDLWMTLDDSYFDAHQEIFEQLGVSYDRAKDGEVVCRFTEAQARAYMLLHVFLHELGHHHDRMNQKHHGKSRGEDYAENFAMKRFEALLPEYVRVFGDPAEGG